MPMIERDFWNGDDEKWDAFCDEALNNLTDKDHKEFLKIKNLIFVKNVWSVTTQ